MKASVQQLLALKITSPEVTKIDALSEFLEQSIAGVKGRIKRMPMQAAQSWEELDKLFINVHK